MGLSLCPKAQCAAGVVTTDSLHCTWSGLLVRMPIPDCTVSETEFSRLDSTVCPQKGFGAHDVETMQLNADLFSPHTLDDRRDEWMPYVCVLMVMGSGSGVLLSGIRTIAGLTTY